MAREKTPKQNRMLNRLLTEAGVDTGSDTARDILEAACGKRYRREMDFYDHRRAIDFLIKKLGLQKGTQAPGRAPQAEARPPRPAGQKTDTISPEQMEHINGLYDEINADPQARIDTNKRTIKRAWPQTVGEGQKIIEMLKSMIVRGYRITGESKEQKET